MGLLDRLLPAPPLDPATPVGGAMLAADPVPVAEAGPSIATMTGRAEQITVDLALSIPSVRKAVHVIAGTIGTFSLHAVDREQRRLDSTGDRAWLEQPERSRSRRWTITKTVSDLIWYDRSVWRVADRSAWGAPVAFERLHPNRVDAITNALDPDTVDTWIIDGKEARPSSLVVFDGAGLGGLRRFGFDLLTIYGQLQAAAGRYAKAPGPYAILKNTGSDLDPEEIHDLLDKWDAARAERSVGYLNDVIDLEPIDGYSARELQLVEAREHAALEVARLFGLPAAALDANQPGASMTYGNVIERRRDLLESLRPWLSVIEDTLSLDDRSGRHSGLYLPRGVRARFDVDAFTRDDPQTRMTTWQTALAAGVLTIDEVRAAEPLTRN